MPEPKFYGAQLRTVKHTTDPATGRPKPLQLTLAIPSYPASLAFLRDIAAGRIPITLRIENIQPPLPEPEP